MNNMKTLVAALVTSGVLFAQGQGTITVVDPSIPTGYQTVNVFASGNLSYVCVSPSYLPTRVRITPVTISSITQANPAVITATGHGFTLNTRPTVTISGVTGTGWSGINITQVATIVDANTFSVPFNSGSLSAPTTTGTFTTTAPRSGNPEWSVRKFFYDGSNNLITQVWVGGSSKYNQKCTDGASSTVNLQ